MRPVVQGRHPRQHSEGGSLLDGCVLVGIAEPTTQGRSYPGVELCLQPANPLAAVIGENQEILVGVPERVKARELCGLHLRVEISGIEGKIEPEDRSQTLSQPDL